jgi:C-terminal processing protease CtpA/Prc
MVWLFVAAIVFVAPYSNLPAWAEENKEACELFWRGQYEEAQKVFEGDLQSTWRDPDSAVLYGSTLKELGKTSAAISVWERIVREHPHSDAAKRARLAILSCTHTSALNSDKDIGILGLYVTANYPQSAKVKTVYPGTPAEKANLHSGDVIVSIDGEPTATYTSREIGQMLMGRPNTRVKLVLKRGDATLKETLTRMHSERFAQAHPELWRQYLSPQ